MNGAAPWIAVAVAGALAVLTAAPPVEVRASMPLDAYLAAARTGDLVFFRSPDVDALHRHVSPMTHVAVVAVVAGRPWLLETHEAGAVAGRGAGVHGYPAAARLREFEGEVVVARVRRRPDPRRVLRAAAALRGVPYMSEGLRAHVAQCKLLGRAVWRPRGMICSEFAVAVLRGAGVLRGVDSWECVTPSDVLHAAAASGEFHPPARLAK